MRFSQTTEYIVGAGDTCRAEKSWFNALERTRSLFMQPAASGCTVVDFLMVLHGERRQIEGPQILLLIKFFDIVELTYS